MSAAAWSEGGHALAMTVHPEGDALAETLDALADWVVRYRVADRRIVYCNTAWAAARGGSPATMVGRRLDDLLTDDERKGLTAQLKRLGPADPLLPDAVTRPAPNEPGRWVAWVDRYLPGPDGPQVLAVGRDVTDRHLAEARLSESEAWFRSLVQRSADVAVVLTPGFDTRYVSPSVTGVFGYQPDDLVRAGALTVVHPDDLEIAVAALAEVAADPDAVSSARFRVRHADGRWRWVEGVAKNMVDEPAVGGLVANVRDITDLRAAEDALAESEARFRGHFEHTGVGQVIADLEGHFVEVNRTMCTLTGYTAEELAGLTTLDLTHPDDRPGTEEQLYRLGAGELDSYTVEKRYVRKDGAVRHVVITASLLRDGDGRPESVAAVVHDVTDRRLVEEQVAEMALRDALTGLPNRALLLDRLAQALDRRGSNVAVLFVDLDQFKLINDSYGHDAGDQLLCEVAARLTAMMRRGDTVGRLGGDEFLIVSDDVTVDQAERLADRVRRALRAPIDLDLGQVFVTASIGIAVSGPGDEPERLLRDADAAMYRAKGQGRDRHALFDDSLRQYALHRLHTYGELRHALRLDELVLHYQPVVDVRTGAPAGFEALLRWNHPERGLIAPAQFLDVAEDTGLIVDIGAWVLEQACRQTSRWASLPRAGAPWRMAVNLSARQLSQRDVVAMVAAALAASGIDPASLVLEVTETAVMGDAEAALSVLRALKGLGVRLSIDDFGTGYSSLMYLKRFPVDELKVDRSFVDGLPNDPEDLAIATSVVSLAHAVGLEATAEGVENRDQLDVLRDLGCDFAQGYLWSPALPAEDAERFFGG